MFCKHNILMFFSSSKNIYVLIVQRTVCPLNQIVRYVNGACMRRAIRHHTLSISGWLSCEMNVMLVFFVWRNGVYLQI
jgi:hypothetical protein